MFIIRQEIGAVLCYILDCTFYEAQVIFDRNLIVGWKYSPLLRFGYQDAE